MSRIKVYDTHTEIINGLFIDIPDEEFTFRPPQEFVHLTRQQIEEAINHVFAQLSLQLRNMSEQQLLEHFDRISQEE